MSGNQIVQTVVYPARLVRTMDPANPTAEAVAVRGDRIRAVGAVDELMNYPAAALDDRYADAVLLPGFVEAHSHAGTGTVWNDTYIGYMDRTDPEGQFWSGCRTLDDVIERLAEAETRLSDPHEPLRAWGLDPIFFPGQPFTAAHLDQVSASRPIHVLFTSGHVCVVNTPALRRFGITADTDIEGVVKGEDGEPSGELQEFGAMNLVGELTAGGGIMSLTPESIRRFGQDGVNTGTTTLTDLGSKLLMDDDGVALYRSCVDSEFPARLNVFHFGLGVGEVTLTFDQAAERLVRLQKLSTDRLRFGNVKLMLDGTIQGFTACVLPPGYLGSEETGIWNVTEDEFYEAFETFHRAGLLIHAHCNGDAASGLFLDTLERVQTRHPRFDHRHTITHAQLATAAQYRRMAALGVCANVFANHIWAWGDQHLDVTLGPDRARRMNAAATALRENVNISLHCDTPVTPLGPLKTIKHAATRLTQSGRVMGEHERISVEQGLRAMTLGAAYMLKMDHEIGSLESGKYADIAVLDDDPLTVVPEEVGDIRVRGTVVGGSHYSCASR